jgi:hypothetical protein
VLVQWPLVLYPGTVHCVLLCLYCVPGTQGDLSTRYCTRYS